MSTFVSLGHFYLNMKENFENDFLLGFEMDIWKIASK